jgi:hypothetical protein
MGIIITSDQAWMGITLNTQQDIEGVRYSVFRIIFSRYKLSTYG